VARSAESTVDPETGEALEKILLELPTGHWSGHGGERVWAKPLGGDRYEVRNTPWYANDVNWGDVVRCEDVSPAGLPIVQERVREGGHGTLRVHFPPETESAVRAAILDRLNDLGATYEEHADAALYALDVEPGVALEPLCDLLSSEEELGTLSWETGWS
jgi:hypothetical protein